MVNFKSELPRWEAEGVAPPESVKKDGWKAGQRPPADYFNWFFSKTYFALKELQEESAKISHLDAHKNDKKNPHGVTAEQVGLGNLTNQKQATKVEFDAHYEDKVRHITKDERETWNSKASGKHNHPWSDIQNVPIATLSNKGIVQLIDSISSTDTTNAATPSSVKQAYDRGSSGIADASVAKKIAEDHVANKNNPHGTNKSDVGLSDVQNFNIATTNEAKAGVSEVKYMTPLLTFEAIKSLQAIKSVNGKVGEVFINKTDVGLSNLDNIKQASKVDFDNHSIDINNPHKVTARQVNAYTREEFEEKIERTIIKHKRIPDNTDLDTIKQSGFYDVVSNDSARTMMNLPMDSKFAFNLEVKLTAGVIQVLTFYAQASKPGSMYLRTFYSGAGWSKWVRFAVEGEVKSHVDNSKNPHNVTAGQTGAYTKEEVDKLITDVGGSGQAEITKHIIDKDNPHGVTKKQVGLENVDNIKQASKTEFDTHMSNYEAHLIADNPHKVTKIDVNLWNVDNVQQASKVDFESHLAANNPHRITPRGIGTYDSYEIDEKIRNVANSNYDTGWINLSVGYKIDVYNYEYPAYRVLNGVTYIKGKFKSTEHRKLLIGTLPEYSRPSDQKLFVVPYVDPSIHMTGLSVASISISPNGDIYLKDKSSVLDQVVDLTISFPIG